MAKLADLDATQKYVPVPDFVIDHETEKAYHMVHREDANFEAWIPKSQCRTENGDVLVRGDQVRARLSIAKQPGQQTLGRK